MKQRDVHALTSALSIPSVKDLAKPANGLRAEHGSLRDVSAPGKRIELTAKPWIERMGKD